jgi:hypothetical protein
VTASCRVCGRQVEVSDSGQPMPCSCINTPHGNVLRYILADCVGPAVEPEDTTVDMSDMVGE